MDDGKLGIFSDSLIISGKNQGEKIMQSHARVVIIGGGIMGVGLLYHLAEAGWDDCVLIEKA